MTVLPAPEDDTGGKPVEQPRKPVVWPQQPLVREKRDEDVPVEKPERIFTIKKIEEEK